MIWSPQEQFGIVIKCPEHGIELRPYQWTSYISGKGGEMARLIYDLMGNVISKESIFVPMEDNVISCERLHQTFIMSCQVTSKNIFLP